jgi:hypothetical protein
MGQHQSKRRIWKEANQADVRAREEDQEESKSVRVSEVVEREDVIPKRKC